MQVSDLYFRLKLILFGILLPISILFGFLLFAPYFLKVSEPFHKSEIAILEAHPLPSKKFLKAIAVLHQKKTFDRLVVVIREDKAENNLLTVAERETIIANFLVTLNLPTSSIQFLKINPSKFGDSDEAAKSIIKTIVSDNVKSILLLTKEFESRRISLVYQKNLASLTVKISTYPFPSELTSSNWFLTDDGFKEIISEFFRYLYFSIRGII
ncbi:MAG: hypothetical protein O9264_06835 [Leptospira sp.]|nr:hypothetical protein [Leptospira sp.]